MKEKVSKIIKEIVEEETLKVKSSFTGPSYHAIQHILRRLDFIMLFYSNDPNKSEVEVEQLREFYNYGWAPAMKTFYNDLNINTFEPFPEMYKEAMYWADSIIQLAGKIAFLNQLVEYEKADLLKLENLKENELSFKYIVDNSGIEYFDRKSRDFFRDVIVKRVIDEKRKKDNINEAEIRIKLREIISNPNGKYISYDTTPEIDEYYNKQAQYLILGFDEVDNFGEQDSFGGIEYWKYKELVETIVGVAIMHTEACLELQKINPKVDLHNTLTYTYYKDKTINIYKNHFGTTKEEIEQIFSCITLNKENFDYYLEYPAASLPMYVQVSDNMLVRMVAGCLGNPFELLHRELKRKYTKDYFEAVNRREERFRNQLYHLFQENHIVKIPKGVDLNFNGSKTDIDAVLFDTQTMTLGLFQLKWQDPFRKSMRERFSRISNLFAKAHEWVEKIDNWLVNADQSQIIETLNLKKYIQGEIYINEVHLFVISRNNLNFTNVENLDDRVAWGTWYQMLESQALVKSSSENRIRDAFIKLKTLSPKNRMKNDKLPEIPNFEMQLGKYRVYYDKD